MPPRLLLEGIVKRFPGIVANDDITFSVEPGEVHALLGENGAGKTTLMEIAYGLYRPDAGRIAVDGQEATVRSPREAMDLGIGMVHQHFTLVPILTVAENIALELHENGGRLDLATVSARIRELALEYGVGVDPSARVQDLSVGELQRVEIMKALYREARILILDEPTSLLTPVETEQLFGVIRALAKEGRSVVFISHKLAEVLSVADRITVLRDGRAQRTLVRSEADEDLLARLMVGDDAWSEGPEQLATATPSADGVLVEMRGVSIRQRRRVLVDGLDLEVRSGEIVGIAGVEGNGQREITELLVGLRRLSTGSVIVNGMDIAGRSHGEVAANDVGFIPGDRHAEGLVVGLSVEENLVLRPHIRRRFSRFGILRRRQIRQAAQDRIARFSIAARDSRSRVSELSGGNQQKVVLARELDGAPRVIVAAQPTRGLDISAERFVHSLIRAHRARGAAIVLISTNLDEIMSLSDRILVLYEGSFVGALRPEEADRHQIGLLMAGSGRSGPERAVGLVT